MIHASDGRKSPLTHITHGSSAYWKVLIILPKLLIKNEKIYKRSGNFIVGGRAQLKKKNYSQNNHVFFCFFTIITIFFKKFTTITIFFSQYTKISMFQTKKSAAREGAKHIGACTKKICRGTIAICACATKASTLITYVVGQRGGINRCCTYVYSYFYK